MELKDGNSQIRMEPAEPTAVAPVSIIMPMHLGDLHTTTTKTPAQRQQSPPRVCLMANPKRPKPMPAYIELFHGRTDPKEELEDWGSPGPIFGPLQFVHTTYACDIKFNYADESQRNGWLNVTEDFVYYDGVYYGDWSVFTELNDDLRELAPPLRLSTSCSVHSEHLLCRRWPEGGTRLAPPARRYSRTLNHKAEPLRNDHKSDRWIP
jgi:hypothetical protein